MHNNIIKSCNNRALYDSNYCINVLDIKKLLTDIYEIYLTSCIKQASKRIRRIKIATDEVLFGNNMIRLISVRICHKDN